MQYGPRPAPGVRSTTFTPVNGPTTKLTGRQRTRLRRTPACGSPPRRPRSGQATSWLRPPAGRGRLEHLDWLRLGGESSLGCLADGIVPRRAVAARWPRLRAREPTGPTPSGRRSEARTSPDGTGEQPPKAPKQRWPTRRAKSVERWQERRERLAGTPRAAAEGAEEPRMGEEAKLRIRRRERRAGSYITKRTGSPAFRVGGPGGGVGHASGGVVEAHSHPTPEGVSGGAAVPRGYGDALTTTSWPLKLLALPLTPPRVQVEAV